MKLSRHIMICAVLLCCSALFSSCAARLGVYDALRYAGENRIELQKVLNHYRTEYKDRQKLKAARFLIRNMPLHKSFESGYYESY